MLNRAILNRYQVLEWDKFLRGNLGDAGQLTEAKPVFDRIKSVFDRIIQSPITPTLARPAKEEIERVIEDFINFLEQQILTFSDVSQRDSKIELIRSKEHAIITSLGKYLSYYPPVVEKKENIKELVKVEMSTLRQEWESEKEKLNKIVSAPSEFETKTAKAIETANVLTSNAEKISNAVARADEWLNKNEKIVQLILKRNATTAAEKAKEHSTYEQEWVDVWLFRRVPILNRITQPSWRGSFVWLLVSLISGMTVLGITGYFIVLSKGDFSLGSALLRISAILAPAYFTLFAAQQYTNHRRLYESYRFKEVSINTMLDLRGRMPEHSSERGTVLEKSLDVIFSEPSLREDIKYDKQLFMEILSLIRKG